MRSRLKVFISLIIICIFSTCKTITDFEKKNRDIVAAISTSDFLNSMGVVSSITGRGETLSGTTDAINYTGIRWIRCGLEDRISTKDMIALHKKTGVKIVFGLLSGGNNISAVIDTARILADAGVLLAVEGNNEPNNWTVKYQDNVGGGEKTWLPVAQLQRDLYKAVKEDSVLKNYPVWNISEGGAQTDNTGLQFLTIPEGSNTIMPSGTQYADYANCHNYIAHPSWPGLHDNQTWLSASPGYDCPVDGLAGNYGLTWRKKFPGYSESQLQTIPRVTTETGISTGETVTEEVQANLFMNLYLSQFKRGWSYTSIYLLRTRANEGAHEKYAIYRMDYTPKQAAHYLHNLTTILEDNDSDFSPGRLSYSISNQPETVHDLLLQKKNGDFFLVLWGERFPDGSDEITVDLGKKHQLVNIFDPTTGTSPIRIDRKIQSVVLKMTNHPMIIEMKN